jgi:hypothetical protein
MFAPANRPSAVNQKTRAGYPHNLQRARNGDHGRHTALGSLFNRITLGLKRGPISNRARRAS